MSTTSLSSCGRCEYDWSKCSCAFEDSYGRIQPGLLGPFYNTMGQPLVYYAQVQPQNFQPRERKQKQENKNCFAKAFKWYTQDFRKEPKQPNPASKDLTGFANWLDTKYGEYLRESDTLQVCRTQQQSYRVSTTDTTTCPPSQTTTTRRFSRLRSPWCKRKSACRQIGDMPCKSKSPNASCQFILQPQDLNRPVSEYCYQTLTTCPKKSETIVISIEALGSKKSAGKSRSMTSICSGNMTRNQIDVMAVQEGPKIREVQNFMAPCDQKCKVIKNIQELPQLPPSQNKSQTLCEKDCPTKEECLIYEEMLQSMAQTLIPYEQSQSLAQPRIPCDQSKECQGAQEVQSQMRNASVDQMYTNKEMREPPGYSLMEKKCDKNCMVNQRSSLVQNGNNRQDCKVRIETEVNTSASQPPCVTIMTPAKAEKVERICDPTCQYNNVVEEIETPQTCASVCPSQFGSKKSNQQFYKKGIKATKTPSKGKSTDIECQCPEEKPFVEQPYPRQLPVEPRRYDLPPCKCFMTEQMQLPVQVPQIPYMPNEYFRSGNEILKRERIASTRRLSNTAFDHNITPQQKSFECMMPEKSESVGLRWGQTCPVKYTDNDVEEIRIPTQTRGTMFPCELSERQQQEQLQQQQQQLQQQQQQQQQRQYNTRTNMKNISSKRLHNECQCPEVKPVPEEMPVAPCQCIVLERIPAAPMQAKPIQREIQPHPQRRSISYLNNVFTKTSQKSTGDVSCGCSETNSLQCGICCPKSKCLQVRTKSVNVSQYPKKINPIEVNVSCQCSENDIKQIKTRSFSSNIFKEEKKIMVNVSCQCSEENVLQYVTPCQYRRNDFENCDATCVHRKLVRSAGPSCTVQDTDSFVVKNSLQVRKVSRTSAILKSDSMQTSDHSINLEKEDYALFMKIICADKLNDGSCG